MARESFRASNGDASKAVYVGNDDLPDEVEVDLDNADPNAFEVIEEDDTPEEDRGRPTSYDPDPSLDEQLDDLRGRGSKKKIEARIKRLSFERETERRAKEEAQRQLTAAVEAARMAQHEADGLRRTAQMSGTALAESMVARNEAAMREAKAKLKQAHELGDTDQIVDAQEMLSRISAENLAIRSRMPRQVEEREPAPAAPQPQQQPAAPQLAPNVAAWIGRNSWFGQQGNEAKTGVALSIHKALEARGVRPESPEYTRELDRGLKAVYSEHQPFEDNMSYDGNDGGPRREARRPNATADAGRENAVTQPQDKRKVTLTRSELEIARKLGVSPQAYAASKMRQNAGGRGAL